MIIINQAWLCCCGAAIDNCMPAACGYFLHFEPVTALLLLLMMMMPLMVPRGYDV